MGFWTRFAGSFNQGLDLGARSAQQQIGQDRQELMQFAGEERQAAREDERYQRNNQIAGIRALGQSNPLAAAEQARALGPEYGWLVQELEAQGKTQAQQGLTDIRTQGATGVGLGQTTLAKAAALPPTEAVSALSQGLNETEQQRMQVQATTAEAATRSGNFNTLFEGAGQAAQVVDQQALIQRQLLDAGQRALAERQLADFMTEVDKSDTPMTEEQARTLFDLKKKAGSPEDFARTFVSTKRQAQDERFVFNALRTDPVAARSIMRRIHSERGTISPVLLDLVDTAASNDRSDAVFAQAYQMLGQGQYDLVLQMAPQVVDPQKRDILVNAVTSLRAMSEAERLDAQRATVLQMREHFIRKPDDFADVEGNLPSWWDVEKRIASVYGPAPDATSTLKNATAEQQADMLVQQIQQKLDQTTDRNTLAATLRQDMEAQQIAPPVVERVLQVLGRDPRNALISDALLGTPDERQVRALQEGGVVGLGLEFLGQEVSGLPKVPGAMRNAPQGLITETMGANRLWPFLFGRGETPRRVVVPPETRNALQ